MVRAAPKAVEMRLHFYRPTFKYGNRNRPSPIGRGLAHDVGFSVANGDLGARYNGALGIGDPAADAGVVDRFLRRGQRRDP